MLRIVLDANILISAFITPKGEAWEVLRQAKNHKLHLSLFILSEVDRTLKSDRIRRKYSFPDDEVERYIADLISKSTIVYPPQLLSVCSDPNDNGVLACAVEAKADYLVTRNVKDFPRKYKKVKVIAPGKFLENQRS
jgi:putative PIN family toxin of toxin-antitoxin system